MPDNNQPLTPRQEASRLNGAKSRGPVTTEGKRKSSQNAATHGLFAIPKITLSNESQPEFEADVRELIEKYQPADCEERKAVAEYAISRWRLERVWLMETAAIDMHLIDVDAEMPETGPQWTDAQMTFLAYDRLWLDSRFFANLGLYEARLRRASERAKRKLDNFLASREGAAGSRCSREGAAGSRSSREGAAGSRSGREGAAGSAINPKKRTQALHPKATRLGPQSTLPVRFRSEIQAVLSA